MAAEAGSGRLTVQACDPTPGQTAVGLPLSLFGFGNVIRTQPGAWSTKKGWRCEAPLLTEHACFKAFMQFVAMSEPGGKWQVAGRSDSTI
jgi:hypothetical protein